MNDACPARSGRHGGEKRREAEGRDQAKRGKKRAVFFFFLSRRGLGKRACLRFSALHVCTTVVKTGEAFLHRCTNSEIRSKNREVGADSSVISSALLANIASM